MTKAASENVVFPRQKSSRVNAHAENVALEKRVEKKQATSG